MEGQNHPLYLMDRDHVNRLLAKEVPNDEDLIDIARLFIRYEGFPGAKDLQMDMKKILKSLLLVEKKYFTNKIKMLNGEKLIFIQYQVAKMH